MPKNKPNKGLLKRIRISKNGKIKMQRAAGRHLRSHKSGKRLRKYRLRTYVASCDAKRVQSMLFIKTRVSRPPKDAPEASNEAAAEGDAS